MNFKAHQLVLTFVYRMIDIVYRVITRDVSFILYPISLDISVLGNERSNFASYQEALQDAKY